MPVVAILVGVACGMLLAAAGLAVWGAAQDLRGLCGAVGVVRWLAGALLLIGAVLAWLGEPGPVSPVPRLVLMAALAAPPQIGQRQPCDWRHVTPILPPLILTGIGLFHIASPVGMASPTAANRETLATTTLAAITPLALAVTICGGLGARALGQALQRIVSETSHPVTEPAITSAEGGLEARTEWSSAVTYALLTLSVGTTAIANLWRQGTLWGASAGGGGLAGAWLAWSAAWLSPRRPARLRAALTIVAASSLIILAAG